MSGAARTFEGESYKEALLRVYQELGPDAVILSTRSTAATRMLGIFQPPAVEITAAPPQGASGTSPARSAAPGAARAVARYQQQARAAPSALTLETELGEVRQMIGELVRRERDQGLSMPDAHLAAYSRLTGRGVPESTAVLLVQALPPDGRPEDVGVAVCAGLAAAFRVQAPAAPTPPRADGPRTICLYGPPGAGKTQAAAKLAAHLGGPERRAALVAVDPYRLESGEMARRLAERLGLPFRRAATPDELRATLRELDEADVAVIDTAGRTHRDAHRASDLRILLEQLGPDERHLVLPATLGRPTGEAILAGFGAIGFDQILLTRLDEATDCAWLLALAAADAAPFGWISAGPDAPGDLWPASPARLAAWVYGGDPA